MLIGNSAYRTLGPLKNPKNDVLAVQRTFRKLGFSTVTLYDGTAQQIRETMENFRKDAEGADWAVLYYAGRKSRSTAPTTSCLSTTNP